ncbi:MAG: ribosome-associated translation inhibitor RaiA [Ignavibacteria bacterium]|nr:ribosome-associated translation inhibitor RaiA [Ignavibacteria bacterium]
MKFTITARHFKAWSELQDTLEHKAEQFSKAHPQVTSTEVVLSEEHDKEVEFIVHVNNHVLSSKDSGYDFDKAIHAATDKMMAQLRKLREKQSDYRRM